MAKKQQDGLTKIALSANEVERVYGVPRGSLANLRCRREGAKYFTVGKKIYYRISDFEAWFFGSPVLTKDAVRTKE